MSNEEEQHDPTCRENCALLTKEVWRGFAHFFECDQSLQPYQIIPYQINFIRDQHTLLTSSDESRGSFNKQIQDIMLLQHDQSSRWGQLLTWKWWKSFICCLPSDPLLCDQKTQYDMNEDKMYDQEKDGEMENENDKQNLPKGAGGEKVNVKQNVVYTSEELLDGEYKGGLYSAFSEMNNDSVVELRPVAQRVQPKEEFFEVKKRKRRQFKEENIEGEGEQGVGKFGEGEENTEVVIEDTETKVQQSSRTKQPPAQQLPNPIQQIQTKELQQPQQPQPQTQTQVSGLPLIDTSKLNKRKQSDDIIYHSPRSPVRPPKRRRDPIPQPQHQLNAQDQFSQLQLNIQSTEDKPMVHSKTAALPLKTSDMKRTLEEGSFMEQQIKNNHSEVKFQKNLNFFNDKEPSNPHVEPSFEQSESYLEDTKKRRKRRVINLYEQQPTIPDMELEIIEEQQPQDLAVKKRRKRRRTILNEEGRQEERALKRKNEEHEREQQELEVIIYSENEDES